MKGALFTTGLPPFPTAPPAPGPPVRPSADVTSPVPGDSETWRQMMHDANEQDPSCLTLAKCLIQIELLDTDVTKAGSHRDALLSNPERETFLYVQVIHHLGKDTRTAMINRNYNALIACDLPFQLHERLRDDMLTHRTLDVKAIPTDDKKTPSKLYELRRPIIYQHYHVNSRGEPPTYEEYKQICDWVLSYISYCEALLEGEAPSAEDAYRMEMICTQVLGKPPVDKDGKKMNYRAKYDFDPAEPRYGFSEALLDGLRQWAAHMLWVIEQQPAHLRKQRVRHAVSETGWTIEQNGRRFAHYDHNSGGGNKVMHVIDAATRAVCGANKYRMEWVIVAEIVSADLAGAAERAISRLSSSYTTCGGTNGILAGLSNTSAWTTGETFFHKACYKFVPLIKDSVEKEDGIVQATAKELVAVKSMKSSMKTLQKWEAKWEAVKQQTKETEADIGHGEQRLADTWNDWYHITNIRLAATTIDNRLRGFNTDLKAALDEDDSEDDFAPEETGGQFGRAGSMGPPDIPSRSRRFGHPLATPSSQALTPGQQSLFGASPLPKVRPYPFTFEQSIPVPKAKSRPQEKSRQHGPRVSALRSRFESTPLEDMTTSPPAFQPTRLQSMQQSEPAENSSQSDEEQPQIEPDRSSETGFDDDEMMEAMQQKGSAEVSSQSEEGNPQADPDRSSETEFDMDEIMQAMQQKVSAQISSQSKQEKRQSEEEMPPSEPDVSSQMGFGDDGLMGQADFQDEMEVDVEEEGKEEEEEDTQQQTTPRQAWQNWRSKYEREKATNTRAAKMLELIDLCLKNDPTAINQKPGTYRIPLKGLDQSSIYLSQAAVIALNPGKTAPPEDVDNAWYDLELVSLFVNAAKDTFKGGAYFMPLSGMKNWIDWEKDILVKKFNKATEILTARNGVWPETPIPIDGNDYYVHNSDQMSIEELPVLPEGIRALVVPYISNSHIQFAFLGARKNGEGKIITYNSWNPRSKEYPNRPYYDGKNYRNGVTSHARAIPLAIAKFYNARCGWQVKDWDVTDAEPEDKVTIQDDSHNCGPLTIENCINVLQIHEPQAIPMNEVAEHCEQLRNSHLDTLIAAVKAAFEDGNGDSMEDA